LAPLTLSLRWQEIFPNIDTRIDTISWSVESLPIMVVCEL
jgi:hypothetical protein